MKLRISIFIIIVGMFTSLAVLLYVASQKVLLNSFSELEYKYAHTNSERILSALSDDLSQMDTMVRDYSTWDDTYNFIKNPNNQYIRSNLVNSTFDGLKINLILFIDKSGRIIFGTGYDFKKGARLPVPKSINKHVSARSILLQHTDLKKGLLGIIQIADYPMLVVSRAILTSKGDGPSQGTVIMGRYLSPSEIQRLSDMVHLSLSAYHFNDPKMPADMLKVKSLGIETDPTVVMILSKQHIAAYSLVKDIYGKPALLFKADMPRDIYTQGTASVSYFIWYFLITGLLIGTITLSIIDKKVTSRITGLGKSIGKIGKKRDLSERIVISGNDELSNLADEVNGMLSELEQSQIELLQAEKALRNGEEKYHGILDNIDDGYYEVDLSGRLTFFNDVLPKLLGYSREDLLSMNFKKLMDEVNVKKVTEVFNAVYRTGNPTRLIEWESIRKDGSRVFAESSVSLIRSSDGKTMGFRGVVRDITERKQFQDKLQAMAVTDQLTGLYNRHGFIMLAEQQLKSADRSKKKMMMAFIDIDGMKHINDAWGHKEGDHALIITAKLLRKAFRESDIIARVGGDEFAVLASDVADTMQKVLISRLKEQLDIYNAQAGLHHTISLSVGTAFYEPNNPLSLDELISKADELMYEQKKNKKSV